MYEDEIEFEQNYSKALEYYQKALSLGNIEAVDYLNDLDKRKK